MSFWDDPYQTIKEEIMRYNSLSVEDADLFAHTAKPKKYDYYAKKRKERGHKMYCLPLGSSNDPFAPEKALLSAVIFKAWQDLGHPDEQVRESAYEWFMDADYEADEEGVTFSWTAEQIGIDEENLRSFVVRSLKEGLIQRYRTLTA